MLSSWRQWALTERGLSPGTVAAYERDLADLEAAGFGPVETLGTPQLRTWLYAKAGAASTVARRIAALRSFYGFLVRAELRGDDPSARLDRPKVPKGLPRPVEDVQKALDGLDPVAKAAGAFLLETGLRISELASLDVAPPAPEAIVVMGKGRKERLVPLTPEARAALDALGGRLVLSKRTLQRRFAAAGFSPHRLRHTFGTDLAASGADLGEIQDLLGHASPATSRVYARYDIERLRRATERRHRR